jgi:transposase
MGRGIRLTLDELNRIDLTRLKTISTDVFRNCLMITMSHFGDTFGSIAQRLGCSRETVIRIRREYRERRLDALKSQKPPRRPKLSRNAESFSQFFPARRHGQI